MYVNTYIAMYESVVVAVACVLQVVARESYCIQ